MNLTFGDALKLMKKGRKASRLGWRGRGMFAYYVPAAKYPASRNRTGVMIEHADSDGLVSYNAYMAIKNVDGTVSTWVPSVGDCLSEDWFEVMHESDS